MSPSKAKTSTGDVERFLGGLSDESRATLEKVRSTIRSAVPEATETISYGIPMFKLGGRPLIGFGGTKRHCALYVMSPAIMEAHAGDLASFDTSKGTVRFPADKPPPATLVKKLVRARLADIEGAGSQRKGRRG
jgi:uncharacterized protein YdhG (YjbR/CyaY superfamily)